MINIFFQLLIYDQKTFFTPKLQKIEAKAKKQTRCGKILDV